MPVGSSNGGVGRNNRNKGNFSSLYKQINVRFTIVTKQRWFRILVPWLLATSWLIYGIKQQRDVIKFTKVQANFPVPSSLENTTHWCYLNKVGTGRMYRSTVHMPYAVEWVAGCWAWLEAHNQTQSTNTAIIAFDHSIYSRFLVQPNVPQWNRPFFHALPVPILLQDEAPTERPTFFSSTFGKDTWFGNTHSCYSLRDRLWQALHITPPPEMMTTISASANATIPPPRKIHIGVVERPARRLISDSSELAEDLVRQYPNATVSYRVIDDDMAFQDQAVWFAQQDMVILAHGAAMTNLLFMRPGSQILELFPTHFFTDMYQTLAQQCGIHHDWYYDGGSNPRQDMHDHFTERGWRRNQNIHITLEQLKGRIEQMMVNVKQY